TGINWKEHCKKELVDIFSLAVDSKKATDAFRAREEVKRTQHGDVLKTVFPPGSTFIDLNYVTAHPDDDSTVQDIEHLLILSECTYEVDTQDLLSGQIAEKSVWWAFYPSVDRDNQKVFPVELIVETEKSVTPHSNCPADVQDLPGKKRLHWTANQKRIPPHFGYFGSTTQETVTGVEIRRECVPLGNGRARIKIIVRAQTPLLIRIWGLKRRVNIEPESIQPQTNRLSDNGVLFFDYGKNSEGLGSESEYSFVISGLPEGELFYPMTNALRRVWTLQDCSFSPVNQVRGSIWEFDFTLKSERCFRIGRLKKWVHKIYQLKALTVKPSPRKVEIIDEIIATEPVSYHHWAQFAAEFAKHHKVILEDYADPPDETVQLKVCDLLALYCADISYKLSYDRELPRWISERMVADFLKRPEGITLLKGHLTILARIRPFTKRTREAGFLVWEYVDSEDVEVKHMALTAYANLHGALRPDLREVFVRREYEKMLELLRKGELVHPILNILAIDDNSAYTKNDVALFLTFLDSRNSDVNRWARWILSRTNETFLLIEQYVESEDTEVQRTGFVTYVNLYGHRDSKQRKAFVGKNYRKMMGFLRRGELVKPILWILAKDDNSAHTKKDLPFFLAFLDSPNETVVQHVVRIVGCIQDPRSVQGLLKVVANGTEGNACVAARVAKKLGTIESLPLLIERLAKKTNDLQRPIPYYPLVAALEEVSGRSPQGKTVYIVGREVVSSLQEAQNLTLQFNLPGPIKALDMDVMDVVSFYREVWQEYQREAQKQRINQ
ncbi:MAG: HEAT repeat domain-containing protein, partial [Planctomycetota bacterium]